jgi:alkylmercury lyase
MDVQIETIRFDADQVLQLLPDEFTQLSLNEQKTAIQIYRSLAKGHAVTVGQLSKLTGISPEETGQFAQIWPGVYFNDQLEIIGFWGIALSRMGHKLRFGSHQAYAWCAWDAIFLPELVGEKAEIESTCAITGKPINITVAPDGRISNQDGEIYISFLSLDAADMMNDVVSNFCHHIYFFSSKEAGEEWVSKNSGTFLLSLKEVEQISKRKNALQFKDVL